VKPQPTNSIILTILFSILVLLIPAVQAQENAPPVIKTQEELELALRSTHDLDLRARILTETAWPAEETSAVLRTVARNQLLSYGQRAIAAISARFVDTPPQYLHDMVDVMMQARINMGEGFPRSYRAAIEKAVWYGDRKARQLAIPECAALQLRAATIPIIDAAYEDPELEQVAIVSLGKLGDDRARFWLTEQLEKGNSQTSQLAARSMMQIGADAAEMVRERATHENPMIRTAAVEALLERPNTLDLSALYAYYGTYPDDDPERRARVRDVAEQLESLMQQIQNSRSSSPDEDG
jgi:hypothetical protein